MTDLAPFTGFSEQQKATLAAPLNADNVKERDQAGRTLSYLEGWRAIEEANRIFGFDGWTRRTVEIKCVAEGPRKIGKAPNQRDGFGVSYICKVQITVLAGTMQVTREGIGAGHGIDADIGLAHESAVKEAETDAMKRALMTFGNQFGLALYDKAKTNVVQLPKKNSRDLYARMQEEIDGISAADELIQWGLEATERIAVLPADWIQILRSRFAEKLAALRQHQATEVVWDEDEERPASHPTPTPPRPAALPARIQRNLDRLKPKPDGVPERTMEDNGHRGFTDRRYIQALRNGGIADRAMVARAHRAWERPAGPSTAFFAADAGKREGGGFDERNPPPYQDIPDHAAGKALNAQLHPMNDRLPDHSAPQKPALREGGGDREPHRAMLRDVMKPLPDPDIPEFLQRKLQSDEPTYVDLVEGGMIPAVPASKS